MNNNERNQESIAKFNYQTQNSKGQLVLFFFQFQLATKMFHWQTLSYANHKTTDKLFDKLADLTDSFLEKFFSINGRPALRSNSAVIVENMTKAKYLKLLAEVDKYLRGPVDKMISKNSELQNIRDEILAEMDQAKYMFALQ